MHVKKEEREDGQFWFKHWPTVASYKIDNVTLPGPPLLFLSDIYLEDAETNSFICLFI